MKTKCKILPRVYFNRPTLSVARSLIAKYLVRSIDGRMLAGKIVETGDAALAHELHANGYATVRERHPAEAEEEKAATAEKPAAPVGA